MSLFTLNVNCRIRIRFYSCEVKCVWGRQCWITCASGITRTCLEVRFNMFSDYGNVAFLNKNTMSLTYEFQKGLDVVRAEHWLAGDQGSILNRDHLSLPHVPWAYLPWICAVIPIKTYFISYGKLNDAKYRVFWMGKLLLGDSHSLRDPLLNLKASRFNVYYLIKARLTGFQTSHEYFLKVLLSQYLQCLSGWT
jgi:hypothetical protein